MHARQAGIRDASGRMFESDLFEFFSRIPPWQPPLLYLPLIAALSWVGVAVRAVPLPIFAGLALAGLLLWTLLEYWLHRMLFHHHPAGPRGRRAFWILHGVHHDWPHDALRLVFPPAISLPLAALFWWLFTTVAGEAWRYPLMVGLACGYLGYDMIHYAIHHTRPRSRAGRFVRRHHLAHHFDDPGRGFGVSSPLWDYVFGTVPTARPPRTGHGRHSPAA